MTIDEGIQRIARYDEKIAGYDKVIQELARDRTKMANERTLLAYIRTGFSLIALGIALIKLFEEAISYYGGISANIIGGTIIVIGLIRYCQINEDIKEIIK